MPTLSETVEKMKVATPSADRTRTEMEKIVEDLIVEVFGDKIDEIVAEKAEEQVMQMLKVLRGPKGEAGGEGKTPIRGLDFDTAEEQQRMLDEITPKKGVHFNDGIDGVPGERGEPGERGKQGLPGINGRDGKNGKDGNNIVPEEIKNKLQSLRGDARLDASAIKNLSKGKGAQHGGGASVRRETPTGAVNGSNTTFTLSELPRADDAILLFINGQFMTPGAGNDYTRSGRTLTTNTAPPTNSNLRIWYLK